MRADGPVRSLRPADLASTANRRLPRERSLPPLPEGSQYYWVVVEVRGSDSCKLY